jgi:hypothetical protein
MGEGEEGQGCGGAVDLPDVQPSSQRPHLPLKTHA